MSNEYFDIEDPIMGGTKRLNKKGSVVSRCINKITFMVNADRKAVDYMLALKAGLFKIRLNEMNDRIMVSGDSKKDMPSKEQPLSDVYQASMINWLTDLGLKGAERQKNAILQYSYKNKFHPIKEYLDSLNWDGIDHLSEFLSHLNYSSKVGKDLGDIFFTKWLVGSIAKVLDQKQNFMLVLDGKQGMGKSYLARWLCPLADLFVEGAIRPEDKDSLKRLISAWLWEVGELEGTTRKADRAALKDFITRVIVTVRLAYGHHDIVKPASASLIGTVNDDAAGFLNDLTGNRRFVILSLEDIDPNFTKVDINQLWAQLYQMYKDGYSNDLDISEAMARDVINEDYQAVSMIDLLLSRDFVIDSKSNDFMSTAQIMLELETLGLKGNQRANTMEMSGILKKAGLSKIRKGGVRGFSGIRKKRQGD